MTIDILNRDPHAPDFAQSLEALCVSIAPNDPESRVPVILETALQHDLTRCTEVAAVALPKGIIGDRPGIMLRNDLIAKEVAIYAERARKWNPQADVRKMLARRLTGITLHELSHIVTDGWSLQAPIPGWKRFVRVMETYSKAPLSGYDAPRPFNNHEWQFIRSACHVAYRVTRQGLDIAVGEFVDFRSYRLNQWTEYYAAIRPELSRMKDKTFAEIRAARPPRDFLALWNDDVLSWLLSTQRAHESPVLS